MTMLKWLILIVVIVSAWFITDVRADNVIQNVLAPLTLLIVAVVIAIKLLHSLRVSLGRDNGGFFDGDDGGFGGDGGD